MSALDEIREYLETVGETKLGENPDVDRLHRLVDYVENLEGEINSLQCDIHFREYGDRR